ncbi:MAG: hypothetical protein AAF389_14915 [Gemmatimonadota bacterium]
MRSTDTQLHEAALRRQEDRAAADLEARERRAAATKRAVGSYLGGGLSLWMILREDIVGSAPLSDIQLTLWVCCFAVCFGLASLDQILNALGKR